MSFRKIIDLNIARAQSDLVGNIAGPLHQLYTASAADSWTWAADVDIGEDNVLRSVPIAPAAQNDVLRWGQAGTGVALQKIGQDKYTIMGVAPMKLSLNHVIYVDMTEYIGSVVRKELTGRVVRLLTYGELADYGGYGAVPYGAYGHFNPAGELIELLY